MYLPDKFAAIYKNENAPSLWAILSWGFNIPRIVAAFFLPAPSRISHHQQAFSIC